MNRLYMSPKRLETFFSCSGLMIKTEVIIFENRMFLTTYNTPLKIHQIIIPILRFLSHHIAFKPLTFWRLSTPLDITKLALEKKVMWKRSVKCFRFLQHLIISPFFYLCQNNMADVCSHPQALPHLSLNWYPLPPVCLYSLLMFRVKECLMTPQHEKYISFECWTKVNRRIWEINQKERKCFT